MRFRASPTVLISVIIKLLPNQQKMLNPDIDIINDMFVSRNLYLYTNCVLRIPGRF